MRELTADFRGGRSVEHRGEVGPGEFRPPGNGRAACSMSPELRGRPLRRLEEFTPERGATTTYRAFLDHQSRRIREVFLGTGPSYRPLRARECRLPAADLPELVAALGATLRAPETG